MKDRNFVKEIEKLRTAVLGYDREEVVLYIRELVEYYGQKNEEAVRELYLERCSLRQRTQDCGHRSPHRRSSMRRQKERRRRSWAVQRRLQRPSLTMPAPKGTHAQRGWGSRKRILAEADRKAGETLAEADRKAGETLTEAERKAGEILAEAGRQAEEILAEAGRQMDVILTKTREKVEKQQALYHQYRSRLEALKNGLDCIFAECPPEEDTRDLHGKPQRPGQIQADGLEETGLREQP